MNLVGRRVGAVAALVWCGLLTWWAYAHGSRVPLLAHVDLGFHELGHLVFYIVPAGDLITAAAGSVFQIAVPAGLAAYFLVARNERVAASVCLVWAATSARDVAVYIADAPYERLPLIGGEHDWAYILGPEQLDRIDQAARYAQLTRALGFALALTAAGLVVHALLTEHEPTARKSDPWVAASAVEGRDTKHDSSVFGKPAFAPGPPRRHGEGSGPRSES